MVKRLEGTNFQAIRFLGIGLLGLLLFSPQLPAQNRQDFIVQLSSLISEFKLEEASSVARQGLQLFPGDPAITAAAGAIAIRLGRFDEGYSLIEAALQRQPQNPDLLFSLAELRASNGEFDQASGLMDLAVRKDPGDAGKRIRFAWMLFVSGRLNEAVGQAQKAVQLEDSRASYRKFYAFLLGLTGNAEDEYKQLVAAYKDSPRDPRILLRLADKARTSGQIEQAVEYLELGSELDPENPLYLRELSEVLEELELSAEASTARQRAGELETAFDSYARALEGFQNQDFQVVIEILEPVVNTVPRFTTGLSLLALAYQKGGEPEKSLGIYRKLLEQDPTLESAVQNSVWIKVDQEDLSGALELLNTSGGGGIDGHLIRGYQRLLEEDWEAALQEFQSAQTQYPLHPRILRQISLCLEELGRSSDALKVLENAYSAYPEDPGIHQDARRIRFNYGLKLEGERQWKQAEKIFERLHLEDPNNPEFLFHLAYCLQNQDQFQNAIQHYLNGLQLGSDSDWVRMNLAYCHTALKQYPEASVQWQILVGRTNKPEYEYHYGLSLVREWKLEEGWSMVRKSARNGYEPAQTLLSRAGLDISSRKEIEF